MLLLSVLTLELDRSPSRSCVATEVGSMTTQSFNSTEGSMLLGSRTYPLRHWLSAYRTIAYQYIRPSAVATFATSIQGQRANRAMSMPLLSAERSDGTCMYSTSSLLRILMFVVEDISEEELYRYTRNRWMHVWHSLLFELCALTLT